MLEAEVPIALTDVQDLNPLVKSALPCSNDASEFLQEGSNLMKEVRSTSMLGIQ